MNKNNMTKGIIQAVVGAVVLLCLVCGAAAGTTVVDHPYTRIISLYPAHTENLYSLGLDKEIIGVSRSDDFPPQVKDKQRFSYREDPERFIAARPDLVLIRPMIERSYPDLVKKLRQAGIAVVSLQPVNIEETYDYWRELGKLTGRLQQAEAMVGRFREGLRKIRSRVAAIPAAQRKRVYFESIHSRMKTFAPTSMAIFALETAGGVNVAADADQVRNTNIADYGKEHILSHAAEIDVFLAQKGRMNRVDVDTIAGEPGFEAIKAVQDGEVYLIDEKIISRPTMRMLEGIGRIAGILYPEYFNAKTAGRE